MCVSSLGIPGARVHAHGHVAPSSQVCGCEHTHPWEAWFQSVTSQLSLPSGGPSRIKFSLHCCFCLLPVVSPPLRAPAETRGTRKERERGRDPRAWGDGLSPQGRLRQRGTAAMVCPPRLPAGCGEALPPHPEEMRPRAGDEGEGRPG